VVDLSELVWTLGVQVDAGTSTEIIFNGDQMTNHSARLPTKHVVHELVQLCLVFKVLGLGRHEDLSCVLLGGLFLELDCENVILNLMEELSQASHCHWDLILVVICALHTLKDIPRDIHQVSVRILNCDLLTIDRLYLVVGGLRKVLVDCEL
jgi:hypothetical protein